MKEMVSAGPASVAPRPVITKIPAPITAPTPRAVSESGPSVRLRVCSPVSAASRSRTSMGFFLNSGLLISNLLSLHPASRPILIQPQPRTFHLFPQQINRNANQNDDQPRPSVLRLVTQKLDFDE